MIKIQRSFRENTRIIEKKNLCFKQFCLEHGSRSKVLKSHSFDRLRQNMHRGSFNKAEQVSIDVFFNTEVDEINSLLTCLCSVHFRGMAAGFLSCRLGFYRFA